MEKRNTHIDDQLKGMFQSFEPSVPFAFDAVAQQLDARKSRRRKIFGSIAATVVITAVSGILFLLPDTASVKSNSKTQNSSVQQRQESSLLADNTVKNSVNARESDFQVLSKNNQIAEKTENNEKTLSKYQNNNTPVGTTNGKRISINTSTLAEPHFEDITVTKHTTNYLIANSLVDQKVEIDQSLLKLEEELSFLQGKSLTNMPNTFGILQLPVRSLLPQMPQQPLSSWAFEVGYDQNQTALAYQISPGREKYVHKNYLNRIREGQWALSAPQLQVGLKYQWNKNWSVSVGLGFAQTRTMQRFDFRDSVPFSVAQGNEADALGNYPIFGYLGLGPSISYEGIQTFQMLSVPLGLGYQVPINRFWTFQSELSMRYHRLFSSRGQTLNYHDLTLMEENADVYRNTIWSTRISAGADYRLSRKQYVGLRINTQGAITPFYKDNASVDNRGWSLGMSVFYTIKLF